MRSSRGSTVKRFRAGALRMVRGVLRAKSFRSQECAVKESLQSEGDGSGGPKAKGAAQRVRVGALENLLNSGYSSPHRPGRKIAAASANFFHGEPQQGRGLSQLFTPIKLRDEVRAHTGTFSEGLLGRGRQVRRMSLRSCPP